jgi:membrane protease YdiL (CAAX protease family)
MEPEELEHPPVEVALAVDTPAPVIAREPFWGYVDLALFIGIGFTLMLLFLLPLLLVMKTNKGLEGNLLFQALGSQLAMYAAIYFALKIVFATRYHKPVSQSLGWRGGKFNLGAYAVGGVLLALVVQGVLTLLHTPDVKSPVDGLVNSRLGLMIVALLAVVAAPIFEEAVFRGFLQPLLSRTFGTVAGILITAALFGSLHWTEYSGVWQFAVAISVLGAIFGWVRVRTNSLIPSTVMHACNNGLAVLGLVLTKYSHLK